MNFIDEYQFGKIIVNNIIYQKDIIIFPDYVQSQWLREKGHNLQISDLDSVINFKPEILIIGTGMFGLMKVDNDVRKTLKEKGIKKILVEKTNHACEIYNKEGSKKKVAALHITC